MTCARSFLVRAAVRRANRSLLAATALAAMPQAPIGAQQPAPLPSAGAPALVPWRPPVIALVQPLLPPAGTGSVPQDKPVVVFRFATGEPDDPLDVRSLVVAVDGIDRTALFQTIATQAWGPLAGDAQLARGELTVGPHRVVARICSTRGACTTAETVLLVVPGVASGATSDGATSPKARGARRVLGAVLEATRKLLLP